MKSNLITRTGHDLLVAELKKLWHEEGQNIYFRNKMNDEKLYKVARFEIGALYEIGRILAENGIR